MVRIVGGRIHVLVLAHRNRRGVLPLPNCRRACPLRHLILVMVLLLRRCVNRLVPPVSGVESAVRRLLRDGIRLPAIN